MQSIPKCPSSMWWSLKKNIRQVVFSKASEENLLLPYHSCKCQFEYIWCHTDKKAKPRSLSAIGLPLHTSSRKGNYHITYWSRSFGLSIMYIFTPSQRNNKFQWKSKASIQIPPRLLWPTCDVRHKAKPSPIYIPEVKQKRFRLQ